MFLLFGWRKPYFYNRISKLEIHGLRRMCTHCTDSHSRTHAHSQSHTRTMLSDCRQNKCIVIMDVMTGTNQLDKQINNVCATPRINRICLCGSGRYAKFWCTTSEFVDINYMARWCMGLASYVRDSHSIMHIDSCIQQQHQTLTYLHAKQIVQLATSRDLTDTQHTDSLQSNKTRDVYLRINHSLVAISSNRNIYEDERLPSIFKPRHFAHDFHFLEKHTQFRRIKWNKHKNRIHHWKTKWKYAQIPTTQRKIMQIRKLKQQINVPNTS